MRRIGSSPTRLEGMETKCYEYGQCHLLQSPTRLEGMETFSYLFGVLNTRFVSDPP